MENVRRDVKIDRVHRLGAPKHGKVRPVVAKFNFFQDKELIIRKASEKLQNSRFSAGDQFPKEVQQRRRLLVPVMKQAQKNGHLAILAFDKLYVDEKLYDPKDPVCVANVERNVRQRRRHNDRRQSSNSLEYEHVPYCGQNANGSPQMNSQMSDQAGQPGRSFTPPGTSSWGTNGAAVHDTGARPKTTFSGPAFGASYSSMSSGNMDTTAPRSLTREAAATSTSPNTSNSSGVD